MSLTARVKDFATRNYVPLLLAALALAMLLRFVRLGFGTLADNEARNALQALNILRDPSVKIGGQPGYVALTSFLFFLFGGSDFFARFWPALFGASLVLVPGLFRKQLKDTTGIILAFLIALEPGLVALSRTADGSMISITALLAAMGFLFNRKLVPAGILFGLSILCSEEFWPLSIALGLTWLLISTSSEFRKQDQFDDVINDLKTRWWIMGLSALVTIVLISTQFFVQPKGISGLGTGIVDYLNSWRQPGSMTISMFLMVFLITQFPAILFGVWGLIRGLVEKSQTARFLGLWWGIGLILWLLNPSLNAWSIVLIDLPLFVLAALQINNLIEGLVVRSTLLSLIETVITISLFIFSIINFLNFVNFPPTDPIAIRDRLIVTLLPLALWFAFTTLLAWGWDIYSTKSGLLIGFGLIFFALLLGSGWKAAGLGSRPENELFANSGLVSGESELLQTITDVSRWNNGQATRMDINVVGLESPSVLWALRGFEKVTIDTAFPNNANSSIVVSSMESLIQSQSLYRGQTVVWSIQPDFERMIWQNWVKWFFLREVPQQKENLLLWVRNDLFKDVSSQQPAQ